MTPELIEARERSRRTAMLTGDAEALGVLMDDQCVYVHSSGFVDTGRAMVAKVASGDVSYLDLEFSHEHVTHFARTAVFVFRQRATMTLNGEAHGSDTLCTAVWSVGDDRVARLVSFHSAFTKGRT